MDITKNDIQKYKDIINLPHHVSKEHMPMSIEDRAAQFASFAALTGFEDEVEETGRLTTSKMDIDEEVKNAIDIKLQYLKEKIYLKPKIKVTYFIPDLKKDGGKYTTIIGNMCKIDEINKKIILENKGEIQILDIIDIEYQNL